MLEATTPDGKKFTAVDQADLVNQLEQDGYNNIVFQYISKATVITVQEKDSQIEN